jgi:hypothetical protein
MPRCNGREAGNPARFRRKNRRVRAIARRLVRADAEDFPLAGTALRRRAARSGWREKANEPCLVCGEPGCFERCTDPAKA